MKKQTNYNEEEDETNYITNSIQLRTVDDDNIDNDNVYTTTILHVHLYICFVDDENEETRNFFNDWVKTLWE